MFSVRLPPELIERIDEYAKQNGESRSEAMRALLEAGLVYRAGKPKPKQAELGVPKRGRTK